MAADLSTMLSSRQYKSMNYPFLLCLALFPSLALGDLQNAFQWSSIDIPQSVSREGQTGAVINGTLILAGGVEPTGKDSARIEILTRDEAGSFAVVDSFSWDRPIGICQSTSTEDGLYLTGLAGTDANTI